MSSRALPRRLWLRRLLLLLGSALFGALVWLFFFSVPIGWAVRVAARRALPPEQKVELRLDGATFRWRWGEPELRVEFRGAAVEARGKPLAAFSTLAVDVGKSGLWHGHYAPRRIELNAPRLHLDLDAPGADASPVAAKTETAAPTLPRATGVAWSAPFAAFLPKETWPVNVRVAGLTIALRRNAQTSEWAFTTIETIATRRAARVRIEFRAALAGPAPAPAFDLEAELPVDSLRLEFSARAPAFSTTRLPAWPGAAALPGAATLAADMRGVVDLATARMIAVSGGVVVSDARLALPELAGPIAVPRFEVRGRASGDPLEFALETGRLEIAGALLEMQKLSGTLGASPRVSCQVALSNLRAAEWLALLPLEVRTRLPIAADALDSLVLERAGVRADAELAPAANGRWRLHALRASGEGRALNEGVPFALQWRAEQHDGGDVRIHAAAPAFEPAKWGGKLAANTPLAALTLPIGATLELALDSGGEVKSGAFDVSAGPGAIAAWGPLPRPVPVRELRARVELAAGGRRLRVPAARLELDGPVLALREVDVALPTNAPAEIAGEISVERFSDAWAELWLPEGTFAPFDQLGLRRGDLMMTRFVARGTAQLESNAAGGWEPLRGEASVEVNATVQAMPLQLTARAVLDSKARQIDATVAVAEFRPAQLRLTLPAGAPPCAAFDFPVSLRATAALDLEGAWRGGNVSLGLGRGTLRAAAQLGVDVPINELALDAEVPADFGKIALRRFAADVGDGLRVSARDVVWHVSETPRLSGELELAPLDLMAAISLLPEQTRVTARSALSAAALERGRLAFDVTHAPKLPLGWRVDRLRGDFGVARVQARAPAAGDVSVGELAVELDYPHATLRARDTRMPAFYSGAIDVAATLDATDFAALRAKVGIDPRRARLLAPALAKTPLVTAPFSISASQRPGGEMHFEVAAPEVLGRPLELAARLKPLANGRLEADVTQLSFGRTRLSAKVQQRSANELGVAFTATRVDADELMRAAGPLLAASTSEKSSKPRNAEEAEKPRGGGAAPATGGRSRIEVEVDIEAVEFGGGRVVRDLRAKGTLVDGWPQQFRLEGIEGAGNPLRAEISGAGATQPVQLAIADASAWLTTLTHPLRATPLPPGELATLVAQILQVPALVAGGSVEAGGELVARKRFAGHFRLGHATMIRPPRVLQLLALKSGKTWSAQPLLERFSIDRIVADPEQIQLDGLAIVGTGLIDRLKVRSASYAFADTSVRIDGEYFGVGFDVKGTRADPQVYLKDSNLLLRVAGQPNEFDFEGMAADAKASASAGPAKR